MAGVKIAYSGTLIAEMDAQGIKTLHTSGKYCKDNIQVAYDPPSGGGGRSRSYDITLAQASGWVMLTALDADVLAHINDPGLIVTLRRMSGHEYAFYAGTVFTCGNSQVGTHGDQPVYGIASRMTSETVTSSGLMLSPANNTERPRVAEGMGEFQVQDGAYYIRPGDGFIAAGDWRLVFNW